ADAIVLLSGCVLSPTQRAESGCDGGRGGRHQHRPDQQADGQPRDAKLRDLRYKRTDHDLYLLFMPFWATLRVGCRCGPCTARCDSHRLGRKPETLTSCRVATPALVVGAADQTPHELAARAHT